MPPPHARPSHTLTTPRLILRTALVSDAKVHSLIRSTPQNNPFGGVREATRPESETEIALARQRETTAAGDNAFLVIVLKEEGDALKGVDREVVDNLRVSDGILIGMSGFNTFPKEKGGDGKDVLVGDTGVLIDYRFVRKGLAIEALEAVIEYGFHELGIEKVTLETEALNLPFQELMKTMELGAGRENLDGDEHSYIFEFGREKWQDSKEVLKQRGKWYLD